MLTYSAPVVKARKYPGPEFLRFQSRTLTTCAESHSLSEGIILPKVAELVCTKHI
jgi:hypothetical protein